MDIRDQLNKSKAAITDEKVYDTVIEQIRLAQFKWLEKCCREISKVFKGANESRVFETCKMVVLDALSYDTKEFLLYDIKESLERSAPGSQ